MATPRRPAGPVRLRLPVAVIVLTAAAFSVLGWLGVREIGALTRAKVHGAVLDLVTDRAHEVAAFFERRAATLNAVLAEPALRRWWGAYHEYRRPLAGDAEWARIQTYFQAVKAADPAVISPFFATDSTGEYFWEQGRVERPGYDPKQRWWWHEALARDHLYVTAPAVDAGTGAVLVTVQTTVYESGARLLGVAGLDIRLDILGKLVDRISYEGAGSAFLVDHEGRIVYFPAIDFGTLPKGARATTTLADVDHLFPDTSGHAALARQIAAADTGFARVRWRGEDRFVQYAPVQSSSPELHWTLGLAVPERVIAGPIDRVRWRAALAIALATLAIAGVTLLVTRRVDAQLRTADRERALLLAEANAHLLEADRMKSRFLASMSHELRTPLNSIIGFSTILRDRLADQVEPRHLHFLDNIRTSGEHLLAMISDILDLSKVEAGRLELHREVVEIPALVQGVCDLVRAQARERDLAVEVAVTGDLPPLMGDPVRLKQVLLNLLANAVKFAHEGTAIRVSARRLAAGETPLGRPGVALAVSDRGIGIEPTDLPIIFDEFRQARQPAGRPETGTGLGLALVKRLVELHGGRIGVESTVGEGSTFTVLLPLDGAAAAPVTATAPTEIRAGATVLVVEDDAAAFDRIRRDLEPAGYRLAWSRTGADAVDLAALHLPAAVILDIVLPQRDGFDILRDLKAHPETASIPVLVVSVLDNHELGLTLGADAYFTKPCDGAELLRTLAELGREANGAHPLVLVVDDDPQLHDMLDEVLGAHGYRLRHAFSAAEGFAITQTEPPDVIILDLMMPVIDGFEAAARLKQDAATRDVPIIIFSVHEPTPAERDRLAGHAAAVVHKAPGAAASLADLIAALLAHRRPPA